MAKQLTPRTINDRLTALAEKWYILDPLYFLVWTTHEAVQNPQIQTVRTGNGRIEYNPDYLNTLSDVDLNAVIQAEIVRIILKHPYLRRQDHAKAAYLASNITIKEFTETPLNFPRAADYFGTKEYDQRHFEFYYQKILSQAPPQYGAGSGNATSHKQGKNGPKGSGSGNLSGPTPPQYEEEKEDENDENGNQNAQNEPKSNASNQNSIDDYTDLSNAHDNTALWDKNEWITSQINDKIENVQMNQSWGTITGKLQELIIASLRPQVDYRRILSAFRQSVLSSKRILTRMKPNRRYEFQYMGSRRDFNTRLLFAFDVSGSISSEDLQRGLATLNQFFKYGIEVIDVIQFDTEIKGKPLTVKKASRSMSVLGRGGTNFKPVIDYINQNRNYDGLIIFTDGYAPRPPLPTNRKTKILWLFNDADSYKAMAQHVKGIGKTAFLNF